MIFEQKDYFYDTANKMIAITVARELQPFSF